MNHLSRTLLVSCVVTAMILSGPLWFPTSLGAANITDRLVETSGYSDMLGGGEFVMIRFGADAAFGVLWGNESNPNYIHIVAIKARYLGVAQVFDETDRRLAENHPIKFYTLYALRLQEILEFRDQNGNGLADYRRGYDGERFTWFAETEDIPKKVDLRTSWTRSSIERTAGAAERTWGFNLSATDLPYVGVNNTVTPRGDGVLNSLEFGFRLRASLEEVDNVTVPNWRLVLNTSGVRPQVVDFGRLENLTFNGKVARYNLKWDQRIAGWDFDPGGNRRLLLEFAAIVGNLIPLGAAAWLDNAYLHRSEDAGQARYESDGGNESVNETSGDLPTIHRLRSPYVEFGGNWSRIARFTWVTNSTVDGVTEPLYAQILAGRRIAARGEAGNFFVGFVLLGGLSYASGSDIVHDPEASTEVLAELTMQGDGGRLAVLVAAVVAAVAVVGLGAFFLRSRRKHGPPPPEAPPP